MTTINVVGCGRVGQSLARLFRDSGSCEVQDLKGREVAQAQAAAAFIGSGRAVAGVDQMRPADIWLFAVPDSQIAAVAAEFARALSTRPDSPSTQPPIAFHCSGFHPAAALEPLRALGWLLASIHPVQTFATPEAAVQQFKGTPCGLEGDEAALRILRPLIAAIGGEVFAVLSERKALYHAAAVFASNFTVVLQAIAREAWAASGVPDEVALEIQRSLARATIENVLKFGAAAITGPAARGDIHVVELQGAEVSRWHPRAGAVYRELSVLARNLAQHQSTCDDAQRSTVR